MQNKNNTSVTFAAYIADTKIEIPLIQRDYVQGRAYGERSREKRDGFVSRLLEALTPGGKPCMLDFVYGSSDEQSFQPIDGQQRLTTLYLLHWVLLQHTQQDPSFDDRMKMLEKFAYKTRISSTRFCEKITQEKFDISKGPLTSLIRQKPWYDNDMQADLTVQAMTEMIDALEKRLKEMEDCGTRATDLTNNAYDPDKKCIIFDLLDLQQYGLSDNIYVKMNARGKQLTPFENWKADFIRLLSFDPGLQQRFSFSIEHEWNDIFWPDAYNEYKDKKAEDPNTPYPRTDERFMHFFRNFSRMIFFRQPKVNEPKVEDFKDTWATVEAVYKDKPENIDSLFKTLDLFAKIAKGTGGTDNFFDDIFYLTDERDWTSPTTNKVRLFGEEKETNMLRAFCKDEDFTWKHVLLYFIAEYCVKHNKTTVDADLLLFVRIARNYLHQHYYFAKSSVTIVAQTRVVDMRTYCCVLDYLISDPDPRASLQQGYTSTEEDKHVETMQTQAKYHASPSSDLARLARKLEDHDYTYGNLSAFKTLLDKCSAGQITCQDVWKNFQIFVSAEPLEKVQAFVALDYPGIEVRESSNRKCVFLGGEFGETTKRWDTHFRHKENAVQMDQWTDAFHTAMQQYGNISGLVQAKKVGQPQTAREYMIKYPHILAAQTWERTANKKEPSYYYAMQNPWQDLDIIVSHSISQSPLGNSYQVCPMANALAHEIKSIFQPLHDADCAGYSGKGSEKNGLIIKEANADWDNPLLRIVFHRHHWHLTHGFSLLSPQLQQCLTQAAGDHTLNATPGMDEIENAKDFCTDAIKDLRAKNLIP